LSRKISRLALWLILVLAAFLRFYKISDHMEFLGDQGRDVIIVHRFLTQGDLMFIGPQTSIGNMYLGPWYYYLMAPALWLANFNPIGPAIMVVLFSLATVWLIWRVGREWFDEKVGRIAALLTAVSPVVIYYSIFSWNPNIMPFFALLSIWLLWRIWQKEEYRKMPLLAFSLAMVLNSHYLGLLLFPVVGIFWLLTLKRIWKSSEKKSFIRYSFFSILIFLFLMSPLVLFDLKHNFSNFNAFKQFFTVRQTTVNFKFYKGFLKLPEIFNQLYAQLLVRQDFWLPAYALFPLILFGFWRERKNKAIVLIIVWLLIGILGLANYKQHIYAHYYGFLWPGAILILSVSLSQLRPLLFWPIVTLFLYLNLYNWHGWQPPRDQLKRARIVARFIETKSQEKKFALALLAERNYADSYRYFLILDQAPLVDLHQEIPEQLFVICEPWGKVDCNPIGSPLWEIAAFGWAKIDHEWKIEGVRIFHLVHQDTEIR